MSNHKKMIKLTVPVSAILLLSLSSVNIVKSVTIQLSTRGDTSSGGRSSLALYQAPPTYNKEPGKPRLNSIIIKSKPYHVNDSVGFIHGLHQTDNGKSWRREAIVSAPESSINLPHQEVTTLQSTTISQDIATIPQYTIECTGEKQVCSETISVTETTIASPTFKPYSQEELDKYLYQATMSSKTDEKPTNKLASIYIEDETVNILETTPDPGLINSQSLDKSKSWNLVNSQTHKHPFDDRDGWVSLEPIPWSSSQIQKWEPNPHTRPQIPSWSDQHQPWSKPSHSSRPQQEYSKPSWQKPTYDYSKPGPDHYNKPSGGEWNYNHGPSSSSQHNLPSYQGSGGHWGGPSSDIITDGRPGSFPPEKPWPEQSAASFHRPTQVVYHKPGDSYNSHHNSHHSNPSESDGQWVLLSSTKGYSLPQRHRSFQRSLKTHETGNFGENKPRKFTDEANRDGNEQQQSMKSHRTVRLTVLPPLNGTTNTTVSHGGLIEVEQTQQTVEEAHREHMAKMMNLWKLEQEQNQNNKNSNNNNYTDTYDSNQNITKNSANLTKANRRISSMRVITGKPMQTKNSRNNAVFAAVGAGMIPATMAMLLPIVLGKRRKRGISVDSSSEYADSLSATLDNVEDARRIRRKPFQKLKLRKKTEVVYF